MSNKRFELKITTDSTGKSIDLENLTVHSAKALATLLNSMISIIEATPGGQDTRIQILKGSAVVCGVGDAIETIKGDFEEVTERQSTKRDIVQQWRTIQSLFLLNGLNYEATFNTGNNNLAVINDQIKVRKPFKVKATRRQKNTQLVFLRGELQQNGGKNPNLHLSIGRTQVTVSCSKAVAKKLNKLLYSEIFISAWERPGDKKNLYSICDYYLTEDLYSEFRAFIESTRDLRESDEYVGIHKKIKNYIAENNFGKVAKLMRLYDHSSSDVSSLKALLTVTNTFAEKEEISELRVAIKELLENKLK